jgi:glycosyltransferase involved in cell wall biosynthesis
LKIGIVAARLGDVDGVSFETLKWQHVLTELGHDVIRCAGALGETRHPMDTVIPEMHLAHPQALEVSTAAFDRDSDARLVREAILRLAADLEQRIAEWLSAAGVEALVVQNAWAIPMQLPLGVALAHVARDTGLRAIAHNHDYWWERERFFTCVVPDVIEEAFPPALPNVRHASINSIAAADLLERRGLHSTVVPNVFDFNQPLPAGSESDARRLRHELGIYDQHLLFVQPTRVVPRKGIELAIELVARLGLSGSVLLMTSPAGDEGHGYLNSLLDQAQARGVELLHQPGRFYSSSASRPNEVAHSLADAYLAADVITYPSLYEGFGNALIESVFFRKLTVVNRYPVYDADIRPLGFRFVELNGEVSDQAVDQLRDALADQKQTHADADLNFKLAAEHFSYDRLRRELRALLE